MNTPQLLKGFRDFYPLEMAFRNWLYRQFKSIAESFGFEEYEGPMLETLDLYAAKSGEELVKKQAFTLTDKSGKILALRPEMTPTLARMVSKKAGSLVFPIKWFSFGPRFRYETPQRGRGREFFQCDVDILGLENPEVDAEVISVAAKMYQSLGLSPTEVRIKINDRKYIREKLELIGAGDEKMTAIFKVIDKKSKVPDVVFDKMLGQEGLNPTQTKQLKNILQDKQGYVNSEWLSKILSLVQTMGVGEFVEFDPTIVRGLDYYTRTVFEGWDIKGEFRSIWGGGRYDNLTEEIGGRQRIPGVGFAMGDMVLEEILKANGKYPKLETIKTKVLVTVFDPDFYQSSLKVTNNLRKAGINAEVYLEPEAKLDKQLKYADRKGIPYVVIIGPEEAAKNVVTLKNMKEKTQKIISIEELPSHVP
ncbi:histidine--tRNA ligase [Candidatus Collierbacteria bacterium]|nr:histidine--tRNA ligase [Candidatus Collierbacteria bacterium]